MLLSPLVISHPKLVTGRTQMTNSKKKGFSATYRSLIKLSSVCLFGKLFLFSNKPPPFRIPSQNTTPSRHEIEVYCRALGTRISMTTTDASVTAHVF